MSLSRVLATLTGPRVLDQRAVHGYVLAPFHLEAGVLAAQIDPVTPAALCLATD
jgi:hypothetical protein